MAEIRLTCPSCATVLKYTQPVTPGLKIKCPKCATVFPVTGAPAGAPGGKPAAAPPAAKPAVPPPATAKTMPAAPKPPPAAPTPAAAPRPSAAPKPAAAAAPSAPVSEEKRNGDSPQKPGRLKTKPVVIWAVSFAVAFAYLFVPYMLFRLTVGSRPEHSESGEAREKHELPDIPGERVKGEEDGTKRDVTGDGDQVKKDAKDGEDKTPPFASLTAVDFWTELNKDREAFNKKYKGKVLELSGEVDFVNNNPSNDRGMIWLKVTEETVVTSATKDKNPWLRISPGQEVKLKGTCLYEGLFDSVIIEAPPNSAIVITSQDLSKEVKTDREAAAKKYKEKFLIIEGECVEFSNKDHKFILKGDGKLNIACYYAPDSEVHYKKVKKEKKVKLVGKISNFDDPTEVRFSTNLFYPLLITEERRTPMDLILAAIVIFFIALLITPVFAGWWAIFEKAGRKGWHALVPVVNLVAIHQIAGKPMWWAIWQMVCCVCPLNFILYKMTLQGVAAQFGKGGFYSWGMSALPMIFIPLLGFGAAEYQPLEKAT